MPAAPSVARRKPPATYWPNSVTVAFSAPSVIVRILLAFALFSTKDSFFAVANLNDARSSVSPAANPEIVGAMSTVPAIDSLPCVPGVADYLGDEAVGPELSQAAWRITCGGNR